MREKGRIEMRIRASHAQGAPNAFNVYTLAHRFFLIILPALVDGFKIQRDSLTFFCTAGDTKQNIKYDHIMAFSKKKKNSLSLFALSLFSPDYSYYNNDNNSRIKILSFWFFLFRSHIPFLGLERETNNLN